MKTKNKLFIAFLFILVSSQYFCGCSIIGLAIGSSEDERLRDSDSVSVEISEINSIEVGKNVLARLKNGESVSGEYLGYKNFPLINYKQRIYDFKKKFLPESKIPIGGGEIKIETANGKSFEGGLLGYDRNSVFIRENIGTQSEIKIDGIRKITNKAGFLYGVESVKKMISLPGLPEISEEELKLEDKLGIETESGKNCYYSLDEIEELTVIRGGDRWLTGLLIGAGIDVATIIVVAVLSGMGDISIGKLK